MTRRTRPALRAEALEDRVTPAVTMSFNAGILRFEMDAANDSLTIGGSRNEGGNDVSFSDGVALFGEQTDVTSIEVIDTSVGGGGQTLTFRDETFFGNEFLALAGSITVTGVESVVFDNPRGPTGVAGGMTITDAVTVTQTSATLPQISLNSSSGGVALRITATGTGDAIGSATLPLRVTSSGTSPKFLVAVTTDGNGNQYYDLGAINRFVNVNANFGPVNAGTGTVTLTNGQFFGVGFGDEFGNASTFNITDNAIFTVGTDETIGGLTGTGRVASSGGDRTLIVGGGDVSTTFAGVIRDVDPQGTVGAGSLALTKTGAGTFTVTGANTYTGGTTVSAGTLVVGGAAGTLGTGAVTNNANLRFDRTADLVVANAISGTGNLQQVGTGVVTLTGNNTYQGATGVDAGATLRVGNGGTAGALGTGGVSNNGTLVFDRSDAVVLANGLSGGGEYVQAGAGTLTLAGTFTSNRIELSAPVVVEAGTLRVATPLARTQGGTALVAVTPTAAAAALTGDGTITGDVTVAANGTLRPGPEAGPGTLPVASLALAAGSTFEARIASGTSFDTVTATGPVALGGATLSLVRTVGSTAPAPGTVLTLVDGTNLSGTFAGLVQGDTVADSAGTEYAISYLNGDVTLTAAGATLAPSTTVVSSGTNPSVFGQSVTFTAEVLGGVGLATGTVTFLDGTETLGTADLDANGQAVLETTALAVGTRAITARYEGNAQYATSTSTPLTQTVNEAATTTMLSGPATSTLGQGVTFTATVAAVAPGSGVPTGTVTFSVDGTTQTTVPLVNGQASFTTSSLAVGARVITATYAGDTNFTTSATAAGFSHTVGAGATPPVAPSALAAMPTGTGILFSWADNSSNETGFEVEVTGPSGTPVITTVGANVTNLLVPGTPGQSFSARVRAVNAAGDSAFSNTASATVPTPAPDAVNDTAAVTAGQSVVVSVRANDSNAAGTTVSPGATAPTQGTATVNANGTITYAANATATGTDTFSYLLDGPGGFDEATVTVTINPAAAFQAVDDSVTLTQATIVNIPVFQNDIGIQPGATVTIVAGPQNGLVTVSTNVIIYRYARNGTARDTFTYRVTNPGGASSVATVTVNVGQKLQANPVSNVSTGVVNNTPVKIAQSITGRVTATPQPQLTIPGFSGFLRAATGDVNGDGTPDTVLATGAGGGRVRVLSGAAGNPELASIEPFPGYTGGLYVTTGDLDGDGKAEIVVTPDAPDAFSGPVDGQLPVRVYKGSDFSLLASFDGLASLSGASGQAAGTRLGGRPAIADVNGDGTPDLLIAAGNGGGPRVTIWDGLGFAGANGGKPTTNPIANLFVFESTQRGGAFIASEDMNGDGFAEVVVGGGPGGGPRVRAVNGLLLLQVPNLEGVNLDDPANLASGLVKNNFFAGDPNNRGGVRVAMMDADNDGLADIVTGSGTNEQAVIRVFEADQLELFDRGNGAPASQEIDLGVGVLIDGVHVG